MSLKILKPKTPINEHQFPDDVDRIVRVCKENGYLITENDAAVVWERYSDSVCASWLSLPKSDTELLDIIFGYTEEEVI